MKQYITTFFNIPNCANAGLNIVDASILDWILAFTKSGKMQTLQDQGKTYYWINLGAIVKDFETAEGTWLGINSTDAVSRRIAKMVKLGILYKKLVKCYTDKNGIERKGTYLFIAINQEKILYLLGEKAEDEISNLQNISDKDLQIIENQPGNDVSKGENTTTPTDIKSLPYGIKSDEGMGCKAGTNINKLYNHKAISSSSSPLVTDKVECDTPDMALLRNGIYSKLQETFNASPAIVFDNFDIVTGIITTCLSLDVTDQKSILDYIDFAFQSVKERQDIRYKNKYFCKIVCSTELAVEYFNNHQVKQQKVYTKICPVCGTEHSIADSECPTCHIMHDEYEKEVELYKKIYALPKEQREALESELVNLAAGFGFSFNIPKYNKLKAEVYEKYGIDNKGL